MQPPERARALLLFHHPRLLRLGEGTDAFVRALVALAAGEPPQVEHREPAAPRVRVVIGPGDPLAVAVSRAGVLADPSSGGFVLGTGGSDDLPEVRLPAGVWPASGAVDRLADDVRRMGRDVTAGVGAVDLARLGDEAPPTSRRDPDVAEMVRLLPGDDGLFRSRRALVVEDRMPTPDRDSGSLSTVQYARALARLGHDVDLVVRYGVGLAEHRRALEREGFRVRDEPGAGYDVALVMRADVFHHVAPRLKDVGTLVYVAVDLHHRRLSGQAEVEGDPDVAAAAAAYAEIERANIAAADLTVVNSTTELEHLRATAPPGTRFEHLPMARPVPAYRCSDDVRDDEVVFLGGFLHAPNVDAVTWFLDEVWPTVAAALPTATFAVYGGDLPPSLAERSDERVRLAGHVPTVEDAFARARVSVVPLRYGAGVKGKLVTAMVNGVPLVATPVGVEGLDLGPDEITVADDAEAFARAVVELYVDRERREAQRRRAYDVARERFTLEALVNRLGTALDDLRSG